MSTDALEVLDERPSKRAKTEELESVSAMANDLDYCRLICCRAPMTDVAGDTKVEDVDDDDDPYSGYVEQDANTRAADLYLDTVSIYVFPFSFFTHPSLGF